LSPEFKKKVSYRLPRISYKLDNQLLCWPMSGDEMSSGLDSKAQNNITLVLLKT